MKLSINELKSLIGEVISEAKKKAKKKPKKEKLEELEVNTDGHAVDIKLDFSAPQGAENLYRKQGQVNWGQYTSNTDTIDDSLYGTKTEELIRGVVRAAIAESMTADKTSEWHRLAPPPVTLAPRNVWEHIERWYDFQHRNLGKMTEAAKDKNKTDVIEPEMPPEQHNYQANLDGMVEKKKESEKKDSK